MTIHKRDHRDRVEIFRPVAKTFLRITNVPVVELDDGFSKQMEGFRTNPGLHDGDVLNYTVHGTRGSTFTQSYRWSAARPDKPEGVLEQLADGSWIDVLRHPLKPTH